jgi:prevent-host-death family protein
MADKPVWDYDRRVREGDFGDAGFVTTKELRANLAEMLNRVAFGGDQIVVKRHGKPFVAIVATYDLQACQALEDYNDAKEIQKAIDSGELDEPGITLDEFEKEYGLDE